MALKLFERLKQFMIDTFLIKLSEFQKKRTNRHNFHFAGIPDI